MGINDPMETVPGMSEESLRWAAMAQANQYCRRASVLQPHEFTVSDWMVFVKENEGRDISDSAAQRELDDLVKAGIMGRTEGKDGKRYDPRSQRAVVAYWMLGDGDGQGQAEEANVGPF